MSKRIPLTQGKFAIVDDADFDWLNQHKWYAKKDGRTWYAMRQDSSSGRRITALMHRVIINAPKGKPVDHVSGDGLDNRRCNLRLASRVLNGANSRRPKNNKSGYKGVCWSKVTNKWHATITSYGRTTTLGYFADREEAARAYDDAAREHFGEFARTNF